MVPETMIDGIEHLFELQALLHSGAYAVSGGRARIAGLSSSRLCTTTVAASTALPPQHERSALRRVGGA